MCWRFLATGKTEQMASASHDGGLLCSFQFGSRAIFVELFFRRIRKIGKFGSEVWGDGKNT
jgi:hypothetical protein